MPINGWVSIHRKIVDWQWYKNNNVYRVFTHLIYTASHEDGEWCGIKIKAGQKITSYQHIATEIGTLSVQQVRSAINKLKSTGEITVKTTNKYTMVTITKYNEYQGINRQNNKQITNKQQTNNKQITTFNKVNNINKVNNNTGDENLDLSLKEDLKESSTVTGSPAPSSLAPSPQTNEATQGTAKQMIDMPLGGATMYRALCSLKPCTVESFVKYYPEWSSKAGLDEMLKMVRDIATWYEGKGKKCGNSILAFNNWISSPLRKKQSGYSNTIGSFNPDTMGYIYENTSLDDIDDYAKANKYHQGRIQEYCLYGGHRASWLPPLNTPEKFITKFKERVATVEVEERSHE